MNPCSNDRAGPTAARVHVNPCSDQGHGGCVPRTRPTSMSSCRCSTSRGGGRWDRHLGRLTPAIPGLPGPTNDDNACTPRSALRTGRQLRRWARCQTGSRSVAAESVGQQLVDAGSVVGAVVVGNSRADPSECLVRGLLSCRCATTHVCQNVRNLLLGERIDEMVQLVADLGHGSSLIEDTDLHTAVECQLAPTWRGSGSVRADWAEGHRGDRAHCSHAL